MREWMISLREAKGKSFTDMAIACNVSKRLLCILEEDESITAPGIADRVARMYGMNVWQRNMLCAEQHHISAMKQPETISSRGKRCSDPLICIDADNVRSLCWRLKISAKNVSKRLEYSPTWLGASLRRGTMSRADINRLAEFFHVEPSYIRKES